MKLNEFNKLLIIILAFILIFALSACSNNDDEKLVISSIEDVSNIEVVYGTSSDDVINKLDSTVAIEVSNGDKETPEISWSAPEDYQATTPGTYLFSGVFTTVHELNGTVEAEVTVLTDEAEAIIQEVENAIAVLPADITLEDEADVISARDAYNSLSPEQQAMVENGAILEAAVTKITELNIGLSEIAITELGNPADITLEDEADVIAARDLVEKTFDLGAAEADIINLEQLIAAEKKITELRDALGELETAVQDAETAIRALPLAENITLADREDVASARILVQTAYDSGAVETDISNLWKLEDAELKIEEIENQTAAAEVDNKITLLPTPAELTMSDKVDVETIRNSYESLTDIQKGLVTNLTVLESAEAVYAVAATAAEVETNADKVDVRFITISNTITQDVNISTNRSGNLTLNGDYLIDANLVVDAANLTFTNKLEVSGEITIEDVSANSWYEEASGNTLNVNDAASITFSGSPAVVTFNASATVTGGENIKTAIINNNRVQLDNNPQEIDSAVSSYDAYVDEFSTITIAENSTQNASIQSVSAPVRVTYKAFDQYGIEITNNLGSNSIEVNVTINGTGITPDSTDPGEVVINGADLIKGEPVTVELTAKDADNNETATATFNYNFTDNPAVKTIDITSNVELIKNDCYDYNGDRSDIYTSNGKTYIVLPLIATDQYGNELTITDSDLEITAGSNLEYTTLKYDENSETYTDVTDNIEAVAVHAAGDTDINLSIGVSSTSKYYNPDINPQPADIAVAVKAARTADSYTLDSTELFMTPYVEKTINIKVVDQYGVPFSTSNDSITVTSLDRDAAMIAPGNYIDGSKSLDSHDNDTGALAPNAVMIANADSTSIGETINVDSDEHGNTSIIVYAISSTTIEFSMNDANGTEVKKSVAVNVTDTLNLSSVGIVGIDSNGREMDLKNLYFSDRRYNGDSDIQELKAVGYDSNGNKVTLNGDDIHRWDIISLKDANGIELFDYLQGDYIPRSLDKENNGHTQVDFSRLEFYEPELKYVFGLNTDGPYTIEARVVTNTGISGTITLDYDMHTPTALAGTVEFYSDEDRTVKITEPLEINSETARNIGVDQYGESIYGRKIYLSGIDQYGNEFRDYNTTDLVVDGTSSDKQLVSFAGQEQGLPDSLGGSSFILVPHKVGNARVSIFYTEDGIEKIRPIDVKVSSTATAEITSPLSGAVLSGPQTISGSATGDVAEWNLRAVLPDDNSYFSVASGSNPIVNGDFITDFDTTTILNRDYNLTLTVIDSIGLVFTDDVSIAVSNPLTVTSIWGNLFVTFNEEMDITTFTEDNIIFTDSDTGTATLNNISSNSSYTASLSLSTSPTAGATIEVSGVTDSEGNPLSSTITYQFDGTDWNEQ